MNIMIGSLMHESNTFNPTRTDLAAFGRTQFLKGDEILRHHRGKPTELGGMLKTLDDAHVTPVALLSATAMCSGVVTAETYAVLKGALLEGIEKGLPTADGILLSLHGSMTAEELEDPEGDLLSSIRALLPEGKYLAASLDHHANVTRAMAESADILVGYRTHPHTDQFEVGRCTARLLLETVRYRPVLARSFVKLPLMTPAENRPEAIAELARAVREVEADEQVLTASFFVGYPWADVSILGASVYVITRDTVAHAERCASRLAGTMWDLRDQFQFPICSVDEVLRKGKSPSSRPVVLNELCDCTLGGAAGDVVTTARYLVERHVADSIVLGIVDASAVRKATAAGVGATVALRIGGHTTLSENPPLQVDCRVKNLAADPQLDGGTHPGFETRLGLVALVEANGVDIVLLEYPGKIQGLSLMRELGIDVKKMRYIVSKEGLNVFITYDKIGAEIVMVESAGFNRQRLRASDYVHAPRPIYPLDPQLRWTP